MNQSFINEWPNQLEDWQVAPWTSGNPVEIIRRGHDQVIMRIYDHSIPIANEQPRGDRSEHYATIRQRKLANLKKAGVIIALVSRGIGIKI